MVFGGLFFYPKFTERFFMENLQCLSGDPMFRAQEAWTYIGTRRSKFYELIKAGLLRQGILLGRCRMWRRSWLDQFLDSIGAESAQPSN